MGLADDIEQSQAESEKAAKERLIFPGTISTVTPLTVILDGSGVAIPCLNFGHTTLKESRRVGVIKVGSDYVVFGTFGTQVLTDLTLDGDLSVADDVTIGDALSVGGGLTWGTSTSVGSSLTGPISQLSATFVYVGLWQSFVAPPSGKVTIAWAGKMKTVVLNSFCYIGYELRDGATNGSGSVVSGHSAATGRAVTLRGFANQEASMGRSKLATGLVANAAYHVRLMHASSDTTGVNESSDMDLSITPEL